MFKFTSLFLLVTLFYTQGYCSQDSEEKEYTSSKFLDRKRQTKPLEIEKVEAFSIFPPEKMVKTYSDEKTKSKLLYQEIEHYSDENPQMSLVVQQKAPVSCFFKENPELICSHYLVDYVRKNFSVLGFEEIRLDDSLWYESQQKIHNYFFCNEKEGQFVLLKINFFSSTETPQLKTILCRAHDSIFSKNKWDYQSDSPYWTGKFDDVNEMSWKYVDFVIHSKTNRSYSLSSNQADILFNKIKQHGLEKTVCRSILTADEKNILSYYSIFSSEEEEYKIKNILLNLIN